MAQDQRHGLDTSELLNDGFVDKELANAGLVTVFPNGYSTTPVLDELELLEDVRLLLEEVNELELELPELLDCPDCELELKDELLDVKLLLDELGDVDD